MQASGLCYLENVYEIASQHLVYIQSYEIPAN